MHGVLPFEDETGLSVRIIEMLSYSPWIYGFDFHLDI